MRPQVQLDHGVVLERQLGGERDHLDDDGVVADVIRRDAPQGSPDGLGRNGRISRARRQGGEPVVRAPGTQGHEAPPG